MAGATKTLLVGWDGADWNVLRPLMQRGLLPTLDLITRQGVTADLVSLPPYLSPMLWNSIATGKRPWRHGVHGFTEIDAEGRVQPVTSRSRKVPAVWNMLTAEKRRSLVVGWYASHPAEAIDGVCVAETFFHPPDDTPAAVPAGSVAPAALAADLAALRVTAETLDPNLWPMFCPGLTPEVAAQDPLVRKLGNHLAELYSVHNVAASLVETEAWDFAAVYFHFLDWVMHDFEKFLAPAAADAPLAAVARYGQVVESACRLQDALLADLLRAAGPGARVFLVSDHGYLTGAQRPDTPAVPAGIAAHHRPMGIFAAAGPGLRRGAHLGTASLLDVAPTLLHAMGLPVGEDMDGKVLAECFEQPAPIARVASWDVLAPSPTMPPVDDSAVLLQRFVELGYVDASALSDPAAAEAQRTVNGWNLGMDLLDAGQAEAALPYLEAASWRNPEISHYAFWLAKCQAKLGLAKLADESVEVLRDYDENDARVRLLLAQLALDLEQPAAALEHVTAAAALGSASPGLATIRALALASKGEWTEAFALLREQVVTHPTTETWLGLARCYLQNRQWADAEAAARQTLACNPRLAAAHLCLARALARQKKKDEAWTSLSEARHLAPNWPPVRQAIAKFFPERVPSLGVEARPAAGPTLLAQARARRAAYDAELLRLRASQKPLDVVPAPPAPGSSGKTFVIVSGLPRSGTSLMMQMLQAGGLAPMADQVRGPNEHNPRGFFEWEAVKQLPRDPHCLEQAEGRAIKVVSALVPYLPRRHRYKIIAITRDAGEIARSQEKMLGLAAAGALPPEKIERHQRSWLQSLAKAANFSVLELNYGDVIAAASAASSRIAEFLGPELLPHPERMAGAVDSALYRNRAESALRS